jgi:hypothetical protein
LLLLVEGDSVNGVEAAEQGPHCMGHKPEVPLDSTLMLRTDKVSHCMGMEQGLV